MADIIRIDENTWSIEDGFVRFFLLEGEEKAAMIDSGVACPDAMELAKTLTDKPIMLINTHGDGDHLSGTASFDRIYMHKADYINCRVSERFPDTKLVQLNDGDLVELGHRSLRIIHIPGHTSGSIAVLDTDRRYLFAGDSVQKGFIFMFGATRQIESYNASLDKLISMQSQYDCIFASHSELKLPADYTFKVKEAWNQVIEGKVSFEMTELHGNMVKAYATDACGFYLE